MNDYERIGYNFIKQHFNIELYKYQYPIVGSILNRNIKKTTVRACTRSGKSFTTGLSCVAYASIYSNSKTGIIAPSKEKTKYIMDYITNSLAVSDLESVVDLDVMILTKLERLKREVNKNRITFKNNSSISTITADVKRGGFTLMGAGYDNIIVDESAELTKEVYTKIYRMLLENEKATLTELGNPWYLNHFHEHSLDPTWHRIRISAEDCIRDGRFSIEQVDMMKKEFDAIDYRVLIDAEFPKDSEDSLFQYQSLCKAKRTIKAPKEIPEIILGIDVARLGKDKTIIYLIYRYGGLFFVKKKWSYEKQRLTKTAGNIIKIIEDHGNIDIINIDSTGVGGGLDDILYEYIANNNIEIELNSFVFGAKSIDSTHYANVKADIFFNLANIINNNNLIILEDDNELFLQLRKIKGEVQSNGKKRIKDDQDKSPDCADAIALGCYVHKNDIIIG